MSINVNSRIIVSRLEKARQGAGTIPLVADLYLLRNHPDAAVLHAILLWLSYQEDMELALSLNDLRENVLNWTKKRFYKAINTLADAGYVQKNSTPTGTTLRVYILPKQGQGLSPEETRVVSRGDKGCLQRRQGLSPEETRVVSRGDNLPLSNSHVVGKISGHNNNNNNNKYNNLSKRESEINLEEINKKTLQLMKRLVLVEEGEEK